MVRVLALMILIVARLNAAVVSYACSVVVKTTDTHAVEVLVTLQLSDMDAWRYVLCLLLVLLHPPQVLNVLLFNTCTRYTLWWCPSCHDHHI